MYSKDGSGNSWSKSHYHCPYIEDSLFRLEDAVKNIVHTSDLTYVRFLAEAVREPAEIWLWKDDGKPERLIYIARFDIEGQGVCNAVIYFDKDMEFQVWAGAGAAVPKTDDDLQFWRRGELLYRRQS